MCKARDPNEGKGYVYAVVERTRGKVEKIHQYHNQAKQHMDYLEEKQRRNWFRANSRYWLIVKLEVTDGESDADLFYWPGEW